MTAFETVMEMQPGWNLGNTMDAISMGQNDYEDNKMDISHTALEKEEYEEKAFNNPLTTKQLIDKVMLLGFKAIRVPVTFARFINWKTDEIDQVRLERLHEIVDWVIADGMYCIINMHHDTGEGGWLRASENNYEQMHIHFSQIWKNIAEEFSTYNDKLIFEGFNEILDDNANWINPDFEAIKAVNKYNQLFVNTIRKSGGYNSNRMLCVNTYAASSENDILNGFVIPKDKEPDKLFLQVHDYTPQDFAWYNSSKPSRKTWGTQQDFEELDNLFYRLRKYSIDNNIPVIIGEFSTCNKNNTFERAKHAAYYNMLAEKKKITVFWWDNGGREEDIEHDKSMRLISRKTYDVVYPDVLMSFMGNACNKDSIKD